MTHLPPLDLLDLSDHAATAPEDHARAILSALPGAEVAERQIGSAVTRYLLTLPAGSDPGKVARSIDAVTLAVGAPARYVGPVGTAVAIEVPNVHRRMVRLRDVIAGGKALTGLGLAIGQDVAGGAVTASLARLPHLLVGGATGQGKSVAVNAEIASLLMRCTPGDVRFVMIDPKRVEFAAYARLPHLLRPIVTDLDEAPDALRDVARLMDERYADIESTGGRARDIEGWNSLAADGERWARVVVVIDELADLIMRHKKTVEDLIVRIAQLGRAAGVHLIVATQYPKADVITPLIKQNIPSRLALTTTDHVASRLIIGSSGAERLTGAGDALWAPIGALSPIRIQSPFVSDDELARIIAWWVQADEVNQAQRRAAERQRAQDARVAELNRLSAAEKVEAELARQTREAREILTAEPEVQPAGLSRSGEADLVAARYLEMAARGERIWEPGQVGLATPPAAAAPGLEERVANIEAALTSLTTLLERTLTNISATSPQEA